MAAANKGKKGRNLGMLVIVGGLLLLSSVAYTIFSRNNAGGGEKPEVEFYGTWKGFQVYRQELRGNASIYYLAFQGGALPLRVPPEKAEAFPGGSAAIRALLLSSSKVYAGFYPENKSYLLLAFPELGRFLANKPFKPVFGILKPANNSKSRVVNPWNVTDDEAGIAIIVGNKDRIEVKNRTIELYCSSSEKCLEGVTKIGLYLLGILR